MKKNLISPKNRVDGCAISRPFAPLVVVLLLFFLYKSMNPAQAQMSQRIVVRGIVTDEAGEPLPGVNIVTERDPMQGTISNFEGMYLMEAFSDDVLTFSFIGFKIKNIPINGRLEINAMLETSVTSLDEVVLVGYGSSKRANIVGSVASISVEELEDFPATSITSLLDGKMAGISVEPAQPTGRPGASTRIQVHGTGTFGTAGGASKEINPLYVVDGFVVTQEEFDLLDPSEVESFSVLKDASAAVYGARGANGVVLIQTKRGKEGKMKVSYSGSYGIGDATCQTEMLSAYDQAKMLNDRYSANTDYTPFSDAELQETRNLNYNWLDDAWKLSSISRHSVTLSGGTDKVRYFAAGTHVYETGNFDNLDVTKYSYRLGLDIEVVKNLTASLTLSIDNKIVDIPYNQSVGTNTMENLFQPLLQAPKWMPHHINGYAVYPTYDDVVGENPFAFFETESYRRSQNKGNTVNMSLKYEFDKIPGLEAQATYSRREGHGYSKEYSVPYYLYEFATQEESTYLFSDELLEARYIENRNAISESYGYAQNYQLNAGLTYDKTINLHNFKIFANYEQTESEGNSFGATAKTQVLEGVETQLGFNNESAISKGELSEGGRLSGIGRLNYSYAGKYIFEGVVRIESSTKFAPGQRIGVFPAFAAGWVISEENFFKDRNLPIDYLKLRGSYGRTGTDYSGAYEYRLQYGIDDSYLFATTAQSGIAVQNEGVVSSGVTWEKSDKTNIGLDARFLDNRLSFSIDGYYNYNFDILTNRKVEFASTSGIVDMVSENLGRMEVCGFDMEMEYKQDIGKNGSWFIKGIFGYNNNKVLDIPTDYQKSDFRYPIGKSTYMSSAEQGYVTNGIIRTQEEIDAINAANLEKYGFDYNVFGSSLAVGMLYFQDIARPGNSDAGEPDIVYEPDGKVTENVDITYIQNVNENFVWKNLLPSSISLGGNWKGLSLSMQFNMAFGTSSGIVDKLARTAPTLLENSPSFWRDYYTDDNSDAKYPSPIYASDNARSSVFWMKDVFQLRLRTLNLSYSIPQRLVSRWGMSSFRIFFAGTNLWSPISTFDYKEDAISRYNTYPLLKTFNLGVSLTL
ncbi:SusC/RagA family TonB-linked outer membrane protein [Geofilum sp. OHC36d9]|uniref:SusC/RagA family TonB-linked outer membrane protein n=1 Tax=Geofilum sp. OHC36d9 TaxID=3458413 RepID=UPI004033D35C